MPQEIEKGADGRKEEKLSPPPKGFSCWEDYWEYRAECRRDEDARYRDLEEMNRSRY